MLAGVAFLLSAAASGVQPVRQPWATITREPARAREKTTLAFGTLGVARNDPFQLAYYSKRTIQRPEESPQVQWADSISCPALRTALERLGGLSPPPVNVPGFPSAKGTSAENVIIGGIIYTLRLDRLSFSTNIDSGLAEWTEKTLRALEPCWRKEAPADVSPTDALR